MTALIFSPFKKNLHMKANRRFYILVIVLLLSFMFCVATNAQTSKDSIRTNIPCGQCEFPTYKSNKKNKKPISPKKKKNEALRREKLNAIK